MKIKGMVAIKGHTYADKCQCSHVQGIVRQSLSTTSVAKGDAYGPQFGETCL